MRNSYAEIQILNKQKFEELMITHDIHDDNVEDFSTVFISISDSNKHSWFKKDHHNVLRLFFDDITEPSESEKECIRMGVYKLFDEKMAKKTVDFIMNTQHKDNLTTYIIHCEAGISRSGAVGTFIQEATRMDLQTFKRINPQIFPNSLVLTLLRKEYEKNN